MHGLQDAQAEVHAVSEETELADGEAAKEVPRSKWDILIPFGTIKRQSTDRVSVLKFNTTGTLLGCQAAGKTIELYRLRDESEALKKAKRRKKRLREKAAKKGTSDPEPEKEDPEEDITEILSASDEFTLLQTLRLKQKISSFSFTPAEPRKGTLGSIGLQLHNNSLEVHEIQEDSSSRTNSIELSGHRSDVRVAALSTDSTTLMTASHNAVKIWNPRSGVCLKTIDSGYGLSGIIVPGNRQAILGTKVGGIEIFDIAGADRTQVLEAHGGSVWSLAPLPDGSGFVSGSADKNVKFWDYELVQRNDQVSAMDHGNIGKSSVLEKVLAVASRDFNGCNVYHVVCGAQCAHFVFPLKQAGGKQLNIRNSRTLQMADDVLCVRISPDGRYIAVALLDSTIKVLESCSFCSFEFNAGNRMVHLFSQGHISVLFEARAFCLIASNILHRELQIFFTDTLKFFVSLYGHKLPVLSMDISSDGALLASGSADKNVKIWGMDFGDCRKSLFAHGDRYN